eukprot:gnl/Spiro4/8833_TR4650_c0_g1_i1.p1 gnl/Spiro4/8833_TR4650_c0_g1~~gnl/Spiro4/8833_TR4650_c0_g1_i1.p1  ORF type:complete len:716 (-),score=188.48 gnl/Spiro4/8833_TR4650_c0_g1_i1:55-2202(-)
MDACVLPIGSPPESKWGTFSVCSDMDPGDTWTLVHPHATGETGEPALALLGGERTIDELHDCMWMCDQPVACLGKLIFTNFRIAFLPNTSVDMRPTCQLPLQVVDSFVQKPHRLPCGSARHVLALDCKDLRTVQFILPSLQCWTRASQTLSQVLLGSTASPDTAFAFSYHLDKPPAPGSDADGWTWYNADAEFARLGLDRGNYRLSYVNGDFRMCPSYPVVLAVPKSFSDSSMSLAAAFRKKNRMPVATWRHPNSDAVLLRSSQPCVGVFSSRCSQDELLIHEIGAANPGCNVVFVADCRAQISAFTNKAVGGGYENPEHYSGNIAIEFLGIPNLHAVRDAAVRLRVLLAARASQQVDESKWLSQLEATQWWWHTHVLLKSACQVADLLENKSASVIVHCSDGWDRTSQLVSLVQLLCDGYYRTVRGFAVLVEKDWLSFGHKFTKRSVSNEHAGYWQHDQTSPIFLQWLDCVWQIMRQFPCAFEFNETFLLTILESVYSGQYGTFLWNSDRERRVSKVRDNTVSVWTYVAAPNEAQRFSNPFYNGAGPRRLQPRVALPDLDVWRALYLAPRHSILGIPTAAPNVASRTSLNSSCNGRASSSTLHLNSNLNLADPCGDSVLQRGHVLVSAVARLTDRCTQIQQERDVEVACLKKKILRLKEQMKSLSTMSTSTTPSAAATFCAASPSQHSRWALGGEDADFDDEDNVSLSGSEECG